MKLLLLMVGLSASAISLAGESVILMGSSTTNVSAANHAEGHLLIPTNSLKKSTGFELKPAGLCSSERCVPVPPGQSWTAEIDGTTYVDMSVVAGRLGMPIVHDSERKIWALGVAADDRPAALELGQAPDFALPDRKGNIVKLSDFRGKRVLLMTWASWCLCRQDLKGWQKVYEELKPQNFELIAVAEDTAGESAAGKYYDESGATFTTLIDVDHRVSALYQMVNVPMGVWIDEAGKVIRPAEVAYTPGFRVLGSKTGDDRYVPALRDWVANGPSSKYVLDAPTLKAKAALRPLSLREAELEFRIGSYLFAKGDRVGAREHWQRAQSLDPDNWNYHRQDWSFDAREATANWIAKVRKLGKKPYYDPITSLGDEVR